MMMNVMVMMVRDDVVRHGDDDECNGDDGAR
jgi:hypothetical protein